MSTSSYILNEEIAKNRACFSTILSAGKTKQKIIIIEKDKFYYSKEKIFTFLDDLKEMGFNYDNYFDLEDEIHIDVSKAWTIRTGETISFAMLVRYLWEGKHPKSSNGDKFYRFYERYTKLKKLLPKHSKLLLLCLAHNIELALNMPYYNSNHALCYSTGCKMYDILPKNTGNCANTLFSKSQTMHFNNIKKADLNNKKEILGLITLLTK